jgi:hypothetical protein
VVTANHPKTSPDHILVQGTLASGATASIAYYTAPTPTVDSKGIQWTITGTEGQIQVVTHEGQWQMFEAPAISLKVRSGKGEVEELDLVGGDGSVVESMGEKGRNTARLYEAFVSHDDGHRDRFPDFEDALKTHELLDWIRKEAGW